MSHGDPEKFRASQPGRAGTGWFARMSEATGRIQHRQSAREQSSVRGRHQFIQQSRQAKPWRNQSTPDVTDSQS